MDLCRSLVLIVCLWVSLYRLVVSVDWFGLVRSFVGSLVGSMVGWLVGWLDGRLARADHVITCLKVVKVVGVVGWSTG